LKAIALPLPHPTTHPTAYRYLAFEAMSAYLQTSAAAQRAGYRPAGYNRLEDLQQIQCPSLVLAKRLTDTLQLKSSLETANASRIACQWRYPNTVCSRVEIP